jgi:hypothetical protein
VSEQEHIDFLSFVYNHENGPTWESGTYDNAVDGVRRAAVYEAARLYRDTPRSAAPHLCDCDLTFIECHNAGHQESV